MRLHGTSLYRTPATIVGGGRGETKQGLTDGWVDWDVGVATYGSTGWQSRLGHEEDYDDWIYHDSGIECPSLPFSLVTRSCATRDRGSSLRPGSRRRRVEGTILVILLDPFQTAFFGFNPSSYRPHHVVQLFWFISWLRAYGERFSILRDPVCFRYNLITCI